MSKYLVNFYFQPSLDPRISLHVITVDTIEDAARMVRASVRKGRVDGYSPQHGGPMSVYISDTPSLAYTSMSEVMD